MSNGPYLHNFHGPGPMHETFILKVFTLHGPETFKTYGYRIDSGYLILYEGRPADNNSVRLNPLAVFAPGGWLGYALDEANEKRDLSPIGFEFRRSEESPRERGH